MLTGPDPVSKLPVNLDRSRSSRLHTQKKTGSWKTRKYLDNNKKISKTNVNALTEMLAGFCGCLAVTLSLSDSDLELLPESLELGDLPTLECATSNDLQTFRHGETSVHYEMAVVTLCSKT